MNVIRLRQSVVDRLDLRVVMMRAGLVAPVGRTVVIDTVCD